MLEFTKEAPTGHDAASKVGNKQGGERREYEKRGD